MVGLVLRIALYCCEVVFARSLNEPERLVFVTIDIFGEQALLKVAPTEDTESM